MYAANDVPQIIGPKERQLQEGSYKTLQCKCTKDIEWIYEVFLFKVSFFIAIILINFFTLILREWEMDHEIFFMNK